MKPKRQTLLTRPALVIVIAYLIVGALYAWYTPTWQAPDEPAHYNYIRALATGEGFPVMEPGDYDQQKLQRLTSEGFPPGSSIESLEYEDHQPPLYYLLATPIFWLSGGSIFALRLFSLVLGAVSVAMVLDILKFFFPETPHLVWLGGGTVAFIPQFLSITASINNDALTFALLWLWLWLALRFLQGSGSPWLVGSVAGALLLTKSTGYGVLILMPLAVLLRQRRMGQPGRWAIREGAQMVLPALTLGALWWGRNVVVYGWPDVMGLQAHNAVVVGQPRTEDWLVQYGAGPLLRMGVRTTFQSFWGQFGWMGVVLDSCIYIALTLLSVVAVIGAVWRLTLWMRGDLHVRRRDGLILVGASGLITVGMYLWHNLTFVQHQGRYLFPALPIVGLIAALGFIQWRKRRFAISAVLVLTLLTVILGIVRAITGTPSLWTLALIGAVIPGVLVTTYWPEDAERWWVVLFLIVMVGLDLWCLFGFLVPTLR
jgi:hypothetical protein